MGELVSVKALTAIIERDKRAGYICFVCGTEGYDPIHEPPLLDCSCDECVEGDFHPFKPDMSRAAKDRRLLIRALNNIVDEWGQYEAAASIDRMIVDFLVATGKKGD